MLEVIEIIGSITNVYDKRSMISTIELSLVTNKWQMHMLYNTD